MDRKQDATPKGSSAWGGGLDLAIIFWTLFGAVLFAITLLR